MQDLQGHIDQVDGRITDLGSLEHGHEGEVANGAAVTGEALVLTNALDVSLDGTARDAEDGDSLGQGERQPEVGDNRCRDQGEHGEVAEMLDGLEQHGTAEQTSGPAGVGAEPLPLHRLAQIMGHDSLDTTTLYIKGTARDLQNEVEKIAWR